MANAIAGMIWKLSAQVVLNLENENFETSSQSQRIDIIEEFSCFLMHAADRRIYADASEEQRRSFITALIKDMARMLEDSRIDVQGPGAYQPAFLKKMNNRSSEYAAYSFSIEEGASFAMRCTLGNHIQHSMGERDGRWIPDYVVGREAPESEAALKRTLTGLVSFEPSLPAS
ncbi:MAG: hypothetical protein ACI9LO_000625 [Planctomycetota bacterium]|jgi:hypothetical protein